MSNVSDIFVSYAREDRTKVQPLVEILEAQGWDVWWDPDIAPGTEWRKTIEQAIGKARCVLVVWSQQSVSKSWVQAEADEGLRRNILVPVLIDEATIPLGFRHIQYENLSKWDGRLDHTSIRPVLSSIRNLHQIGEIKKEQERQRADLHEIIRFLVQNFLSEFELVHLKKLGSGETFPFSPSEPFATELRRLLSLGLIARLSNRGIRSLMRTGDDVRNHLVITDRGRAYLNYLLDVEKGDDD